MSDETSKMIAGLMEDNKRLKERVQFLEDLAEENRSEYEKLWAENERLRKAGDAMACELTEEFIGRLLIEDWEKAKGVQS